MVVVFICLLIQQINFSPSKDLLTSINLKPNWWQKLHDSTWKLETEKWLKLHNRRPSSSLLPMKNFYKLAPLPVIITCKLVDLIFCTILGFPSGSDGKKIHLQCGNLRLIPGLGRSPGEGNSYSLQYSGLENSMDRGAWKATHKEIDTTEWLSLHYRY